MFGKQFWLQKHFYLEKRLEVSKASYQQKPWVSKAKTNTDESELTLSVKSTRVSKLFL